MDMACLLRLYYANALRFDSAPDFYGVPRIGVCFSIRLGYHGFLASGFREHAISMFSFYH